MKRFMQLLATKLGEVDTISARFDKIDLQLEKITRDEQFFKSYDDRLDSLRRAIIYHCESESADGLKAVDLRSRELIVCQALTKNTIFIMGFARSSTTITAEIVNSASNILLMSEANWHIENQAPRFRDWYNRKHIDFDNQVSKLTYAPNFIPDRDHTWWEWILAASADYRTVGDKLAFSAAHFDRNPPDQIRAFFEARFFRSRYIFLIRGPVQTMLSVARLADIREDEGIIRQIVAWLQYVQFWADCVRTFPNTLTLISDNLDIQSIGLIEQFVQHELRDAAALLDQEEKRNHILSDKFPSLSKYGEELNLIFQDIQQTLSMNRVSWQMDQKRRLSENDTRRDDTAVISTAPHPIGQVWARSTDLIARLKSVICE